MGSMERRRNQNPLNGNCTQNGWGRLTAVQYQDENTGDPFSYMYSYNTAGRGTAQHMNYNGNAVSFDAAYSWDTEGRMTGTTMGTRYTRSNTRCSMMRTGGWAG